MKFYGDFHLHSHFSRATSKNMTLESLELWAKIKGITVVGTGDLTHPGWFAEMKKKLEPAEPGLFKLKKEHAQSLDSGFKNEKNENVLQKKEVRFILTGEMSAFYTQEKETRNIPSLVFLPDFKSVEKLQKELNKQSCDLCSNGSPVLPISFRDLLKMILEINEKSFLMPVHIWSRWFLSLGNKKGIHRIKDVFCEYSSYIKAVEIGWESDPPMNWVCSHLDPYTLMASSDAHSPEKIGHNATIFNTELSYNHIIDAIKNPQKEIFGGTVHTYPQEGKHYFDGHRTCGICWSPLQTQKHSAHCSECKSLVTTGILNRVAELSDRISLQERPDRPSFFSIIPLQKIIAEIWQISETSKKATQIYQEIIKTLGSELDILLEVPISEIQKTQNLLGEAIGRMRNREVHITPGFDGKKGIIKIFQEQEKELIGKQNSLFTTKHENTDALIHPLIDFDLKKYKELQKIKTTQKEEQSHLSTLQVSQETRLSAEQKKIVQHKDGPCFILGEPGTGKTKALMYRMRALEQQGVQAENIVVIRTTNSLAREMKKQRQTIQNELHFQTPELSPTMCTFLSLGLKILRKNPHSQNRTTYFTIINEEEKKSILRTHLSIQESDLEYWSQKISEGKQNQESIQDIENLEFRVIFEKYEFILRNLNIFDRDDLLSQAKDILEKNEDIRMQYQKKWKYWIIDDFQEITPLQYSFFRVLCPQKKANICIASDPNQSEISKTEALKTFKADYPNAQKYKLTKNYRMSDMITKAAAQIIGKNKNAEGKENKSIQIRSTKNDKQESNTITQKIKELTAHGSGSALSDIVVLVRTPEQIPLFEETFSKKDVPFQTIADTPFYQKTPISNIIDVLRYLQENRNIFLQKKLNIYKDRLYMVKQKSSVVKTLEHIVVLLFRKEQQEHAHMIKKLIDMAEDFGNDTQEFLDFLDVGQAADTFQKKEHVTIMLLTDVWGREFPIVFIPGCEEGILPYSFSKRKLKRKYERQLFYKGMTRTSKKLFLFHAQNRFIDGQWHQFERSRFLDKIEKSGLNSQEKIPKKREDLKQQEPQMKLL